MMQQFLDIKKGYKDCILFFRLGDFYEMFFEDAITASKELEITLTGRDCGLKERAPMCGVPFHAAQNYLDKLLLKGFKVAVCEQVEEVSQAKGLVKRDVVRVLTPGTLTESSMLDHKKNNYLMSVFMERYIGLAVVDISTGELLVADILYGDMQNKLYDEMAKFMPTEMIVNSRLSEAPEFSDKALRVLQIYCSSIEEENFEYASCKERIEEQFGPLHASSYGKPWVHSLGALLKYLDKTSKVQLEHIKEFQVYEVERFMSIDLSSRKNLEISKTLTGNNNKGTLLSVLDRTKTSMGGRMLRKWIEEPLIDPEHIGQRLDGVEELKDEYMLRMEIREAMHGIYDMERLLSRVVLGNANARDLLALKQSVQNVALLKTILVNAKATIHQVLLEQLDALEDVFVKLEASICEDPPVTIKDGGLIKEGYSNEVDRLRLAFGQGKNWILKIENQEREKTGIKNLKISYNKVFGYYIEITQSHLALVPDYFIRKQTLSNCERYITDELKEIEESVLGAEEKCKEIEHQLFVEIRQFVLGKAHRIKSCAQAVAVLDVLSTLSEVAEKQGYQRPHVDDEERIEILDGRHPVVENIQTSQSFIPNDTFLDLNENRTAIITGPNMAGKSTYMRQVAILVLMAQMGSFLPAKEARIGVVDKIFTRVGAFDDLSGGKSTFMVEMAEVSHIIRNATKRSLIILDEIGRGTSTYDGLSIAWAVIEHINDKSKIGARTLFATHYHELTELSEKIMGVNNYCIEVQEKGEDIVFLRKIKKGGADGSYGVQVAKLAGVPSSVIVRAKEILEELEKADIAKLHGRKRRNTKPLEGQLDLFSVNPVSNQEKEIINRLKETNLSQLTPLDALHVLYEIQNQLK
jgi:DNA mismatch repair protein MutS